MVTMRCATFSFNPAPMSMRKVVMPKLRLFFGRAKDAIFRSFNCYWRMARTLSPRMIKATTSCTRQYSMATFSSSHCCCINPTYLLMLRTSKATQV